MGLGDKLRPVGYNTDQGRYYALNLALVVPPTQTGDRSSSTSRYEQIALDLAKRIVSGEYPPGTRVSGRSTLAGTYHVSPETVRRAIALLHSRGILTAEAGKGIIINSASQAARFLDEFNTKSQIDKLVGRIAYLRAERHRIDEEIGQLLDEILVHNHSVIGIENNVTEVIVPDGSPLAGETLATTQIRAKTGATVVAVSKGGEDIFSPPPDLVLEPGDLLVIVGSLEARGKLKTLLTAGN